MGHVTRHPQKATEKKGGKTPIERSNGAQFRGSESGGGEKWALFRYEFAALGVSISISNSGRADGCDAYRRLTLLACVAEKLQE